AARISEHDALIARALILVSGGIDTLRDIARLRMQVHLDVGLLPMKAVLLVADLLDRQSRAMGEIVLGYRRWPAGLAGDYHAVRGRKRFASNTNLARVPTVTGREIEEGVDDLVGNAVADFVRMAFRHGLAGEQITRAGHWVVLLPKRGRSGVDMT